MKSFKDETNNMKEVFITKDKVSKMDREDAILVYKCKLYVHDNHQFAFKQALEEEGLELGFDIEKNIDEIANKTYSLGKNNNIYTYSVFCDDKNCYFIAHFKNHLVDGWESIKDYIESHNYIFGYFNDESDEEFIIFQK